MILSTKCNPVHCSAHPRIQAIKPLAFPPPQSSILADGTFVPYLSSSSKSYTALWKSLPPPFPYLKTDCSPVSTFPVASQTETVFFFLSAPLSPWSQCIISSESISLSGCKTLPCFTLYHCLHFILLCFGSDDLPLYPDPVPLKRFILLSAPFFPWSLCSQWLPPTHPIPVISTDGHSLLSGIMIHYRTVRYWFQACPFLVTPPPEQASFCTVHRITFLLSICLFHIIISPFSICIIYIVETCILSLSLLSPLKSQKDWRYHWMSLSF